MLYSMSRSFELMPKTGFSQAINHAGILRTEALFNSDLWGMLIFEVYITAGLERNT